MAWTRNSGHDDIIGSGGSFNTRRRDLFQGLDLQIFAALGSASMDLAYGDSYIARP